MTALLAHLLPAVALGFVSGILSGMFGIGGGIITTPGIRLLLGGTAMDAVATPLVGVLPGAITGAIRYVRAGLADVRTGLTVGGVGACFSVLGALGATRAGGRTVLIGTAGLILYAALDTVARIRRMDASAAAPAGEQPAAAAPAPLALAAIGVAAGLCSGFFGVGGGFIIVPALARFLHLSQKRATATSLLAVAVLSIPGLVTHAVMGNINWPMATGLVIGVIPGALVGVRITLGSSERATSIGFALLLAAVGVWLAASEVFGW